MTGPGGGEASWEREVRHPGKLMGDAEVFQGWQGEPVREELWEHAKCCHATASYIW